MTHISGYQTPVTASAVGFAKRQGGAGTPVDTAMNSQLPSKRDYYWQQLKRHYLSSGGDTAPKAQITPALPGEIQPSDYKTLPMISFIAGLGLMFTALSLHARKLMHVAVLMLFSPLPINNANRTMPKLAAAYDVARQGNPNQADRMFHSALNQFSSGIMEGFLKPVSYAFMLTTLLALPQSFAKPKQEFIKLGQHYAKFSLNFLRGKERFPTQHPHPDVETRTIIETLICSPLERLNRLGSADKTWLTRASEKLERMGWPAPTQPISLWYRFNTWLLNHGKRIESWIRKFPGVNKLMPEE